MSHRTLWLSLAGLAAMSPRAVVDAQATAHEPSFASENEGVVRCLRDREIRESRILDDGTILFFSSGDAVYVNALNRLADVVLEPPRACIGLEQEEEIEFARTRARRVCTGDEIEVQLDGGEVRPFLPTCRLGVFYRISQAEADELIARRRARAQGTSEAPAADDGAEP